MSERTDRTRNKVKVDRLSYVLGMVIRGEKQRAGLLSRELAAELGLSMSSVSAIENGRIRITADTLVKVGKVLGVPAWLLLRDAEKILEEFPQ